MLARWGAAVLEHLPRRRALSVLDLGAGTGIFARAWPAWASCRVVAVEPAAAMRARMVDDGLPSSVRVIGGRAEHVPLRPGSIDVVWLSAVIHHVDDLDASAREIARVLARDGAVLVRGLFADLGSTPGLEHFPGAARAVEAFPAVAEVEHAFARHGLRVAVAATVEDAGPETVGQVAARVRDLRAVDTLLRQFSDDEITAGLTALAACDPMQPVPRARLGLVVLRRSPSR